MYNGGGKPTKLKIKREKKGFVESMKGECKL